MFSKTKCNQEAMCKTCNQIINISNKGKHDLIQNLSSQKHKKNIKVSENSMVDLMEKQFLLKDMELKNSVAAVEAALCFHTIKHHFSYNSADCTHKLNNFLFKDSKIASTKKLGRTKTEAIVNSVLSPFSIDKVREELSLLKVNFIAVCTDGSNYGAIKIFPVLIQYYNHNSGIVFKLIDFKSVTNEKSETICNLILETLKKFGLESKCIAFGADNCNTNFGGIQRKNDGKNVFNMLKNFLPSGSSLYGIRCPAHILHNCMQHSLDLWPFDVESSVLKIFNYFSIYTVRTESLKEFCSFVDVEYEQLLRHSRIRWLSLFPAIERILKTYDALKSYFKSIPSPPKQIINFFNDPLSEAFLFFIHSLSHIFSCNIKKLEKEENSILQLIQILDSVKNALRIRKENRFIPIQVQSIIDKSNMLNENEIIAYKTKLLQIYVNSIEYLDTWTLQFETL